MDSAPGGRLRVHVLPAVPLDRLLLSGFSGEVWLEPGVTRDEALDSAGLAQPPPTEPGGIGLVHGAGNVTATPELDVLRPEASRLGHEGVGQWRSGWETAQ